MNIVHSSKSFYYKATRHHHFRFLVEPCDRSDNSHLSNVSRVCCRVEEVSVGHGSDLGYQSLHGALSFLLCPRLLSVGCGDTNEWIASPSSSFTWLHHPMIQPHPCHLSPLCLPNKRSDATIRSRWVSTDCHPFSVLATDISSLINKRVGNAVASMLGTTGDFAHEMLTLAVDILNFVPIPRLAAAAKMLLNIWDTLQLVDVCCIIPTLSLWPITDVFNQSRLTVSHASAPQRDVEIFCFRSGEKLKMEEIQSVKDYLFRSTHWRSTSILSKP